MKSIKKKYLEMKLQLVEKEISFWESKQNSCNIYLREHKSKQWKLIEQLEKLEVEE